MRRRKSSLSITLVLIGASALSSCGDNQNTRVMRRDVYSSLEDCRADWEKADDCEMRSNATSTGTGTTGRTSHYFGPRYYWADSAGRYDTAAPRPGSRATGVTTLGSPSSSGLRSSGSSVSRGGFGSSSATHGGSSVS